MPSGLLSPPKFAASTALPQPPSTSHNVPRNSAANRFVRVMVIPDRQPGTGSGEGTPARGR